MHLIQRIEQFLTPPLEALGFNLIRVSLTGNKSKCLQVMIERLNQEPVTIGDCVLVNREVSTYLDVEDPIKSSYNLEVTSAGLNRPLVKIADYQRFLGEKVKIQTLDLIQGRRNFVGILTGVNDTYCIVQMQDDIQESLQLNFSDIAQAHLEPDTDFKTLINNKAKK